MSDMGHEVIGLDNFSPYYDESLKRLNEKALNAKGVEILTLDLRDAELNTELPSDINYIFHFAYSEKQVCSV